MLPLVRPHVDLVVCQVDERVRRAEDRVRLAGVGEHRAVVIEIARAIEKTHSVDRADRVGEAIDDIATAAFADIGDTFDETRHDSGPWSGHIQACGLSGLSQFAIVGHERLKPFECQSARQMDRVERA